MKGSDCVGLDPGLVPTVSRRHEGSPPFLWQEGSEERFLFPEEGKMVLSIDKNSAVARNDWFAVKVNTT